VRAWFVFLADFHTVPLAAIGLFSVPLASTVFYSSWDQCLFCRGGTPLAGPYDPMLQLAMKSAHDKGVVLIAAAGNLGPKSPPLYPAADPNVIAVTAVDQNDHLFAGANQGPYIAVAAPGVNVLEPAPGSKTIVIAPSPGE
jgi:subtilisin family serine protease